MVNSICANNSTDIYVYRCRIVTEKEELKVFRRLCKEVFIFMIRLITKINIAINIYISKSGHGYGGDAHVAS